MMYLCDMQLSGFKFALVILLTLSSLGVWSQTSSSTFPVIKITATEDIPNEPKVMAQLSYSDAKGTIESKIGIELRGNTALKFPKKSYDLEFRLDSLQDESQDFTLAGLRNDDDWILNSLYNQPLMLRSQVATDLWLQLRGKNAASKNAMFAARQTYVEVYLNDKYQGLYGLMEQVDRKQLGVMKMTGDTVQGQIFKANATDLATSFKESPEFKNALPNWAGFQMKYPYENFDAHWNDLADFVKFVSTSSSKEFAAEISAKLDIDNAVDYYIFMNLLHATDNWSKNYFLAKQSKDSPFYFVPWDLDGVMGNFGDGMRIKGTDKVFSNGLFDRLLSENPENFKGRLKDRWNELHATTLSYPKINDQIRDTFFLLTKSSMYEREEEAWNQGRDHLEEFKFLTTWLSARLLFLDDYFEGL